jgi:uncharacterized protein
MAIDWSIDRRGLFSAAAAAFVGSAFGFSTRARAHAGVLPATLVSAARIGDADGGVIIDSEGLAPFALPGRGHAILRLSESEILLVGRRPGTYATMIDLSAPERGQRVIAPVAGHRFAGHAALSPDKRLLVTSEIDAETGMGIVAARDGRTGVLKGTYPVGIEPHDLVFVEGGERLVVAAGGIAKAADVKGAPSMNLGNIESALVELDTRTGAELKRHVLPASLKSLSLRHLAPAPAGETVAFGMQDQDKSALRPLMGILRVGRGVDLLPLPPDDATGLRSYVGSVAIDMSGTYLASTSPKGGLVGLWRLSDGKALAGFKLPDVCGLAAGDVPGSFFVTSGFGDVVMLDATANGLAPRAHWHVTEAAFDNHLLKI